jgi:cell division protein ZapA
LTTPSDLARVAVRILDKEYFIVCPPEERKDLQQSAEYLNAKMREIRDTGKVVGIDRIAVIAALNMANELVKLRGSEQQIANSVTGRITALRGRVETALQNSQQLEL